MGREREDFEFESAVTAAIAALTVKTESTDLKAKLSELKIGKLLSMQYEHEITDDLLNRCKMDVERFYSKRS